MYTTTDFINQDLTQLTLPMPIANTSVRYDSIRRRVLVLDGVTWYIKADVKNGFRQFGTHPSDWRCQVYCNGIDDHYIDLACPFGKTNSTLEFCPPVKLFAMSVVHRWRETKGGTLPRLSSYVDDIYMEVSLTASSTKWHWSSGIIFVT